MADLTAEAQKAKGQVEQAGAKAAQVGRDTAQSSWVEGLARLGYVVRGVLYALVGLLAVGVATGTGGATTDKEGALGTIAAQPFGKVLLAIIAIGLAGYSLWGLVRALLDPLGRGTDPKGLAQRAGYLVSALSYGSLIVPTVAIILGTGGGNQGGGQ